MFSHYLTAHSGSPSNTQILCYDTPPFYHAIFFKQDKTQIPLRLVFSGNELYSSTQDWPLWLTNYPLSADNSVVGQSVSFHWHSFCEILGQRDFDLDLLRAMKKMYDMASVIGSIKGQENCGYKSMHWLVKRISAVFLASRSSDMFCFFWLFKTTNGETIQLYHAVLLIWCHANSCNCAVFG